MTPPALHLPLSVADLLRRKPGFLLARLDLLSERACFLGGVL